MLSELYTFGSQPVAGYLDTEREDALHAPRFELGIVLCERCGHVQQAHDLARPLLLERVYSGYQPTYSMSPRVSAYADWFVEQAATAAATSAGDLAVEVGSNDGQLLGRLVARGFRATGFEPALNLAARARANGLDVVQDYFGVQSARRFTDAHGYAKLLVTRHTLEHAFDPIDFLEGISHVLQPAGMAVVEVPYIRLQMLRGHFEAMTFQHVSFFCVRSLAYALSQVDLELVDLRFVHMDGGSLIAFARKGCANDSSAKDTVADCLQLEDVTEMHSPSGYRGFFDRVTALRRSVKKHLGELAQRGRHVCAYGAGGKGQSLLNMLELDSAQIRAVIDDTPGNAGRYVPGAAIMVITSNDPAAERCDTILLTAPTHIELILDKELKRRPSGVRYMATVPDFHYVMLPKK